MNVRDMKYSKILKAFAVGHKNLLTNKPVENPEPFNVGKELAKSGSTGQIKIHRKDGLFQTEHTYGKDPRQIPKLRVYGPIGRPL